MNDYDDLARAWQRESETMRALVALNRESLMRLEVQRAGALLAPLKATLWFEIACGVIGLLLLGSFAFDERVQGGFLVPAAILMIALVLYTISAVRALVLGAAIAADAPVAAAQRSIETLRAGRLGALSLLIFAAPLLWVPLFIVGMRGIFGVDVYADFSHAWLWSNAAFGAIVLAGCLLAVRYVARAGREPALLRGLGDLLTGASLQRARTALAAIERFECDADALEGT